MGRRLLALQVQSSFQNSLHHKPRGSLRSRRLEAVGTKKKTGAREGDTRVSLARTFSLSATTSKRLLRRLAKGVSRSSVFVYHLSVATPTKCHAGASHTGLSSPRLLYRSEISQWYRVNAKRPLVSV